jgi:ornithine cyclodeaminase
MLFRAARRRVNIRVRTLVSLLVLSARDLRELLPMRACIDAVDAALRKLAAGDAVQPLRTLMRLPADKGLLGMMPAQLGGAGGDHAIKVVSVFPRNHGTGIDAHQGAVLLFEGRHGRLTAVLDGSELTAIRTAAASAVATRALAREDSGSLAIVGTGVEARTHVEAMLLVRRIAAVRVAGRDFAKAQRFAAAAATRHGVPVTACADVESAVRGALIVCTTTNAREPVVRGAWLAKGCHVNAVGSCTPHARELDGEAVAVARLYTDRRESLLHEAGDFLLAKRDGLVGDDHVVGELGDVLAGRVPGRRSADEITLFESLGIGVEDLAAAQCAVAAARAQGRGAVVEFGAEGSGDAAP